MKNKSLSSLFDNLNILKFTGSESSQISSLAYDSREVGQGSLFFALKGVHTDGHKYIDKAIEMGAAAIVHSDDIAQYNPSISYIQVANCRQAMSPVSSAFYGFPSQDVQCVGVTGTDGKSTTVSLIHQLLDLVKKPSGYISTVDYKTGETVSKCPVRQSTPEAPTIHKFLREMAENGKEYAVVESTSHGLSEKTSRLKDVRFKGAVLTNVTHEHLEFHGSLEQYRYDKANLFRMASDFAIINFDDENHQLFANAAGDVKILYYSTKNESCDFYARDSRSDSKGSDFTLVHQGKSYAVRLNIPGLINIENLMAALGAVSELAKVSIGELVEVVPRLQNVKGRMARIEGSQNFDIYVDYAHTPGSYKKVFPLFREAAKKRLITLFGSAGERDIEKRAVQGEIADSYSDIIILTDEDPRLEDSMTIISDIKKGIKNKKEGENLFLIADRTQAIGKAMDLAEEGDMIITLGKGHESSIEYADGHHPWDEISVVEDLLSERGYR